jgi:antirestriction protein ArdC
MADPNKGASLMPTQVEIQKQITNRILEGLKNGVVPWRKTWRPDKNSGAPTNVISHRPYSGCNILLLDLVAISRGYTSRHWGTFEQWKSLDAQVRKRPAGVKPGQFGTSVIFYRQITKTKIEDGEEKTDTFPVLRTYTVFNVDQVDGSSVDHLRASTDSESPLQADYEPAQKAIDATGADIRFGGNRAFYARPVGEWPNHSGGDFVQVPHPGQFIAQNEFYSTSFHELAHWSEVRLAWKGGYALGELIAEIGACYMCAQIGIPCSDDLSNHTSYLASWLKELENDPKAILKAASQASKATEYVLGFSRKAEPQPEELQSV